MSPIRPGYQRRLGVAAGGQLAHPGRLTALHFHSIRAHTYDFFRTRPRGVAPPPSSRDVGAVAPHRQFGAAPLSPRWRVPSVRAPGQDLLLYSLTSVSMLMSVTPLPRLASLACAGGPANLDFAAPMGARHLGPQKRSASAADPIGCPRASGPAGRSRRRRSAPYDRARW